MIIQNRHPRVWLQPSDKKLKISSVPFMSQPNSPPPVNRTAIIARMPMIASISISILFITFFSNIQHPYQFVYNNYYILSLIVHIPRKSFSDTHISRRVARKARPREFSAHLFCPPSISILHSSKL